MQSLARGCPLANETGATGKCIECAFRRVAVDAFDPIQDAHDAVPARLEYLRPLRHEALRAVQGFHSRSEEHTSELQSLMRISSAAFCLKKKNIHHELPRTESGCSTQNT